MSHRHNGGRHGHGHSGGNGGNTNNGSNNGHSHSANGPRNHTHTTHGGHGSGSGGRRVHHNHNHGGVSAAQGQAQGNGRHHNNNNNRDRDRDRGDRSDRSGASHTSSSLSLSLTNDTHGHGHAYGMDHNHYRGQHGSSLRAGNGNGGNGGNGVSNGVGVGVGSHSLSIPSPVASTAPSSISFVSSLPSPSPSTATTAANGHSLASMSMSMSSGSHSHSHNQSHGNGNGSRSILGEIRAFMNTPSSSGDIDNGHSNSIINNGSNNHGNTNTSGSGVSPYVRCPLCDIVLPRDAMVVDDHYRSSMHAHNAQRYQMVMSQRATPTPMSAATTGTAIPTAGSVASNHTIGHITPNGPSLSSSLGSSLRINGSQALVPSSSSSSSTIAVTQSRVLSVPHTDDDHDERLTNRFTNLSIHGHGQSGNGNGDGDGRASPLVPGSDNFGYDRTTQATSVHVPILSRASLHGLHGNTSTTRAPPPGLSTAPPGFGHMSSTRSSTPSLSHTRSAISNQQHHRDHDDDDGEHHEHYDDRYYDRDRHLAQQQQGFDHDHDGRDPIDSIRNPMASIIHHDDYHNNGHSHNNSHGNISDGAVGSSSPGLSFFSFGMHIDRHYDGNRGNHPSSAPPPMATPPRHIHAPAHGDGDGHGHNDMRHNDPSLGRSPSDSSAAWSNSPSLAPMASPLSLHHQGQGHQINRNLTSATGSHRMNGNGNNQMVTETSPALNPHAWPTLGSPAGMNGIAVRGPSSTPGRSSNIINGGRLSSTAGTIPSPLSTSSHHHQHVPPNLNLSSSSSSAAASSSSTVSSSSSKKAGARRVDDDKREMRPGEDRRVAAPRPKQSRPLHNDVVRRMEVWINKLLLSLIPRPATFETRDWLKAQVQRTVQNLWPDATVDLFGSSVTRLCEEKGDVDLVICLPSRIRLKPRVVVPPPSTSSSSTNSNGHGSNKGSTGTGGDIDGNDDDDDGDDGHDHDHDDDHDSKTDTNGVAAIDDEPLPPGTILTDASEIVEQIGDLLKAGVEYQEVNPLPKARVPIVKFFVPSVGLRCDMGVNNHLALRNSRLIRDYSLIDDRLRQLAYFVKYWARRRKINDPYRGTLSSYCYVLMLINFLQVQKPPVLPCLQSIARRSLDDPKYAIQGFDTYYYEDIGRLAGFGSANRSSVPELLVGFLRLYAYEFDFHNHIVSVRVGGYLAKKDKKWGASGKRDRHFLSVEDPFEVSHDLGRVCDKEALFHIRGEFMRAHRCLYNDGGDLHSMCQPYSKEWREDRGKMSSPAITPMTGSSGSGSGMTASPLTSVSLLSNGIESSPSFAPSSSTHDNDNDNNGGLVSLQPPPLSLLSSR